MTTLATGFAAAVQPVSAQTQITTDTQGLTAGEVKIPAEGRRDARLPRDAREREEPPDGAGGAGDLRRPRAHQGCRRRLAKAGYLAVAPELYARQGDVSKLTDINEIRPIVVARCPTRR